MRLLWTILLVQTELLVETADAAASVYHLLLTSVEGMTLGAHLDADVLLGGTGLDHIATGAPNRGLLVVRMDAFLHLYSPLSPWRIVSHNATDIIPQGKWKCNCFLKKIIFSVFTSTGVDFSPDHALIHSFGVSARPILFVPSAKTARGLFC